MSDIIPLCQHTPYLQSLNIPLNKLTDSYSGRLPSFLSITMLKLSNVQSSYVLTTILKSLPNLTHLKVNTSYIDYDGYRWSRIINDFLPKLKFFHLKMHVHFCDEKNTQERINQLIDSFRTRFWIENHQWFIQCDCISKDNHTCILLHTLPYTFSSDRDSMIIFVNNN
ncbi:unnamed protein product [Adineta steineri]|nr:unnamed protein product [Adineta steineri]